MSPDRWVDGDRTRIRPHLLGELGRAINPQYDGWADQYGAVLYVLGIDTDLSVEEVRRRVAKP